MIFTTDQSVVVIGLPECSGTLSSFIDLLGCEAFPHGTIHPEKIDDTRIEFPWLDWASFLYDANLAGLPACAIPMGIGDEGLPMSLQIIGDVGSDYEVLRIAEAIEALIGWDNSIVSVPSAAAAPRQIA